LLIHLLRQIAIFYICVFSVIHLFIAGRDALWYASRSNNSETLSLLQRAVQRRSGGIKPYYSTCTGWAKKWHNFFIRQ